jgi:single-strand DNA-binding protein
MVDLIKDKTMAGSLNKVILIGNLGKDPESKTFQSGDKAVSFTLATSESWRDKNSGERKEKTEWHNVVIYNDALGKIAEQYLKKGMKVYLEGAIQQRSWDDQASGQKRYISEIVLQKYRGELQMLDSRGEGGNRPAMSTDYEQSAPQLDNNVPSGKSATADFDDEIPF